MIPKYEGEGRFSNGVAAIIPLNEDGTEADEKGIRLTPFYYSGCEIASISKWDALISEEFDYGTHGHLVEGSSSQGSFLGR